MTNWIKPESACSGPGATIIDSKRKKLHLPESRWGPPGPPPFFNKLRTEGPAGPRAHKTILKETNLGGNLHDLSFGYNRSGLLILSAC